MSSFHVDFFTPHVGGDFTLEPVSLTITSSLASPAKSIRGVFAVPDRPFECHGVQLRRGEEVLMEGKIDRLRFRASEDGITLELEARDKGAALLDNEARPKSYQNLTVSRMFQEHIEPHGFLLVQKVGSATIPAFTIRKGQSVWDAFVTLTRLCSGYVPFVVGDMVIVGEPDLGTTRILGGEEHPITSITHTLNNYSLISQVYIRDQYGAYSTAVSNEKANYMGISRTRYYIPAGEYYCLPSWDADQRIRRSNREREVVNVTLPGIFDISPGNSVFIQNKLIGAYNLMVEEIVHSVSSAGEMTKLMLKTWLYY